MLPDDSSTEVLATSILCATAQDYSLDPIEDLLSLIKPFKTFHKNGNPGIFRNAGARARQRVGSPVKSNKFF